MSHNLEDIIGLREMEWYMPFASKMVNFGTATDLLRLIHIRKRKKAEVKLRCNLVNFGVGDACCLYLARLSQ